LFMSLPSDMLLPVDLGRLLMYLRIPIVDLQSRDQASPIEGRWRRRRRGSRIADLLERSTRLSRRSCDRTWRQLAVFLRISCTSVTALDSAVSASQRCFCRSSGRTSRLMGSGHCSSDIRPGLLQALQGLNSGRAAGLGPFQRLEPRRRLLTSRAPLRLP